MKQLHCGRIIGPALTAAPKSHPWIIPWSKAGYKTEGIINAGFTGGAETGAQQQIEYKSFQERGKPVLKFT